MAPYGLLQSLLSDVLLARTIREAWRVLEPGGLFALDLVPDVPKWREYTRKLVFFSPEGPRGQPISLRETVRQDEHGQEQHERDELGWNESLIRNEQATDEHDRDQRKQSLE